MVLSGGGGGTRIAQGLPRSLFSSKQLSCHKFNFVSTGHTVEWGEKDHPDNYKIARLNKVASFDPLDPCGTPDVNASKSILQN